MTEEITPVSAPVPNRMEMIVETNTAPVEQKSPEMVTTEPKTDISEHKPEVKVESVAEVKPEPIETSADDKANALAREKLQEKLRADDLQRQLDASKPKAKELGEQPKIENFDTLENYNKALIDWAKEVGKQEAKTAHTQEQQNKQELAIRADIAVKEQAARVKHKDFDNVVGPIVPVIAQSPLIKDFLARNPLGAEVIYELGKNPSVLEQLIRSDNWSAGEQLLNIAARLKKPVAALPSNAPEPIKPVGSRETVKPRLAELAAKDINGYIALRNRQELAKRRAN